MYIYTTSLCALISHKQKYNINRENETQNCVLFWSKIIVFFKSVQQSVQQSPSLPNGVLAYDRGTNKPKTKIDSDHTLKERRKKQYRKHHLLCTRRRRLCFCLHISLVADDACLLTQNINFCLILEFSTAIGTARTFMSCFSKDIHRAQYAYCK